MSAEIWAEKYRPRTLDEYVWRDAAQRQKVEEWIAAGGPPHLLLAGVPGTGKTSLANLILLELGIPEGDILKIPASRNRKIEDIQDQIIGHVTTWALGDTGIKYIILEEADRLSPYAQDLLRNEMEEYFETCRFFLTCNEIRRITEPVQSRCQGFVFKTLDRDEFTARLGEILVREEVEFEIDTLLAIVEKKYPDLRKCIQLVQESTVGGKLMLPTEEQVDTKDYLLDFAQMIRAGRTLAARQLLVSRAQIEEYPDIFRFLYRNLTIWGESEEIHDHALLAIRKGLVNHSVVADPEINLSATCVELKLISQGKL